MTTSCDLSSLKAGFADPVIASQAVFRHLLTAMSRPGTVAAMEDLPPADAPLHQAAAAVCLTLVDFETPVWLDAPLADSGAVDYLRFHCGCSFVEATHEADFAVVATPQTMPALDEFKQGTAEFPDRSTTLIIQVPELVQGEGLRLSGPGIQGEARLRIEGLPDRFWEEQERNHKSFPLGVDMVFATPTAVAALPRTTKVVR